MNSGPHFSGSRFDYRKWAISDGSRFEVRDDLDGAEGDEVGRTETGERGHVANVYGSSDGDVGDGMMPLRSPMDELGGGLFGGPGADLFGARYADAAEPVSGPASGSFAAPHPREESGGPSSLSMFGSSSGFDAQSAFDSPSGFDSQSAMAPAGPEPVQETGSLVRPYTRTGGRTRPDYDLAIEALIETSERGRYEEAAALPEHRSICGLCIETRSVAEVAAYLRLPLGVVRVLIGDMAGLGLVMIHQSGLLMGDRPSLAFLERVLSGLRKL